MKLTDRDIQQRLSGRQDWTLEKGALVRTFTFAGFPDAIAFVTRLAFDAEAADHHPDLEISYKRVTVRWSTHSEGGVTEKDFKGVEQADSAAAARAGASGARSLRAAPERETREGG
jgi:4a-hydroxytetrahydrobiopterin dehydratase